MQKVKIYKATCTRGYRMDEQGEGYSLYPWGEDTRYYEGYDDGGQMYILPDGYRVGESVHGELCIYNSKDSYCPLIKQYNSPAIVDGNGAIMLRRV